MGSCVSVSLFTAGSCVCVFKRSHQTLQHWAIFLQTVNPGDTWLEMEIENLCCYSSKINMAVRVTIWSIPKVLSLPGESFPECWTPRNFITVCIFLIKQSFQGADSHILWTFFQGLCEYLFLIQIQSTYLKCVIRCHKHVHLLARLQSSGH